MKKLFLLAAAFLSISSFAQSASKEFSVQKGYKGSFETGFAAGAGEVDHNRWEFLIVNGY